MEAELFTGYKNEILAYVVSTVNYEHVASRVSLSSQQLSPI